MIATEVRNVRWPIFEQLPEPSPTLTLRTAIQAYCWQRFATGAISKASRPLLALALGTLEESFGAERPIVQLDRGAFTAWKTGQFHETPPTTRHHLQRSVRGFCAWAFAHGYTPVELYQRSDVIPTLSPFAAAYLKAAVGSGQLSPSTALRVQYRLAAFTDSFGARPIDRLTTNAVDRFFGGVAHNTASTRRLYLSAVRGFCKWLVRRGTIKRDPTDHIKIRQPRSVPRAFSQEQISALLRVLPDARAHLIVRLMLDLGLRCVEVARLEMADYDPASKVIVVVGKGGHQRELPVVASTVRALDNYTREHGLRQGPMIHSYNDPSKAVGAQYISNLVVGWIKEAGLKGVKFDGRSAHALRHTAASDVLDQCGDLRVVQEMLGHLSLTTTQIYLRHAGLDKLREGMAGRQYHAADTDPTLEPSISFS